MLLNNLNYDEPFFYLVKRREKKIYFHYSPNVEHNMGSFWMPELRKLLEKMTFTYKLKSTYKKIFEK